MAYADLMFYKVKFFGIKISDETFDYYINLAADYLNANYDISVIDNNTLSKACCAIAEVFYDDNQDKISSEKVGDYSVSYTSDSKDLKTKLSETAARYFPSVGWC